MFRTNNNFNHSLFHFYFSQHENDEKVNDIALVSMFTQIITTVPNVASKLCRHTKPSVNAYFALGNLGLTLVQLLVIKYSKTQVKPAFWSSLLVKIIPVYLIRIY